MRALWALAAFACSFAPPAAAQDALELENDLPLIVVDRPGTEIDRDARVRFAPGVIATQGEDAVVIVRKNGVFLDFEGSALRGAPPGAAPDTMDGVGILVEAEYVTLENLTLGGYRVGVLGRRAHGLVLSGVRVEEGFRQRLRSTWEREDSADWLRPHHNDHGEWRRNYGAAISVEQTVGLLVSGCRARRVQNGLILDRVQEAVISSNDFSYLSGWGLALWRSSGNLVTGNRFDFCVRGYAHGRYNRGQDSAGILLFEQSSQNHFERNSATHGGDGVFGFAGWEALGRGGSTPEGASYLGRGSNFNTFDGNVLSYAAAHGLELTFSFGNVVRFNRLEQNGICGLWLGYTRESLVEGNWIAGNGEGAYGAERGGLNAEHAQKLLVRANRFEDEPVGVRLWTDGDPELAQTPWVRANGQGARENRILDNEFARCERGLELDGARATELSGNFFHGVKERLHLGNHWPEGPDPSEVLQLLAAAADGSGPRDPVRLAALRAERVPPRPERLVGRKWIAVHKFGPHDWEAGEPWLQPLEQGAGFHRWRLLARPPKPDAPRLSARLTGPYAEHLLLREDVDEDGIAQAAYRIEPRPDAPAAALPYQLELRRENAPPLVGDGCLLAWTWEIRAFALTADPRTDEAAFRTAARSPLAVAATRRDLTLEFGPEGPSAALGLDAGAPLPKEHFGLWARTAVVLPAGTWQFAITSDDGVRLFADGVVLHEDWTHHAPRTARAELTVAAERVVEFEVEYFQLDGHAALSVQLERKLGD